MYRTAIHGSRVRGIRFLFRLFRRVVVVCQEGKEAGGLGAEPPSLYDLAVVTSFGRRPCHDPSARAEPGWKPTLSRSQMLASINRYRK